MENRIRILLLSLAMASTSGCSWFHWHHRHAAKGDAAALGPVVSTTPAVSTDNSDASLVDPQVVRRKIKVPHIRPSNFEIGTFAGELSIEDFGSQPVYGLVFDMHLTEDLFAEARYGRAHAGRTSFETLSNIDLLTNDQRQLSYYNLSAGWNFLPGEVFIGRGHAMNTAVYVLGGVGSTKFAGNQNFTVNAGAGFRVLPTDWLSLHLEMQDLMFNSSVTGVSRLKHNLQGTIGASIFF